jgi:hypothetical protein
VDIDDGEEGIFWQLA